MDSFISFIDEVKSVLLRPENKNMTISVEKLRKMMKIEATNLVMTRWMSQALVFLTKNNFLVISSMTKHGCYQYRVK